MHVVAQKDRNFRSHGLSPKLREYFTLTKKIMINKFAIVNINSLIANNVHTCSDIDAILIAIFDSSVGRKSVNESRR